MFVSRDRLAIALIVLLGISSNLPAQRRAAKPVRKPFGIAERTAWTSSRIIGTPDPPSPYTTEVAFPKVKFESPVDMTLMPDGKRWLVTERFGKIVMFDNKPNASAKEVVLDLTGRATFAVMPHRNFDKQGELYVAAAIDPKNPSKTGMQISRFKVKSRDPLRFDPKSEEVLLQWSSNGHKGGCMQFGPEGFLYISSGDGSGIADQLQTGQDISDLEGSILRIDIDNRTGDLPYAIPKDNPFVNTPGARGEIWSFGHRQPWRFSFDRKTNRLWAGEVGQDLWEMVYIIKKGGNYGWSIKEGAHPFRPERKQGPGNFVAPIVEHPHHDFRSITGGYVYHSKRLADLDNAYIYADYDTGRIWSLRYDGKKVTDHRELVDTPLRIVSFAQDNAGEVFIVDLPSGQIHRLKTAPPPTPNLPKFPRKLSETGLFASTKNHQPMPGLVPYSVNSPLWSDHANKDRYIALPGKTQIQFDAVGYPQPAPGAPPGWRFPDGTVIVKTFSLNMEAGNPKSARRLETRVLHHKRMSGNDDDYGAQVWLGYTYIWNDEQTDAFLAEKKGADRTFTIRDAKAKGGVRKQTWHFPSRAECTLCHTMSAKYVLGVNTLQMNRDHNYGGVVANQLETLDHLGLFDKPLPKKPAALPRLPDYQDTSIDLNLRARSYLHSNCSHCHRKWGGGNAEFQLLATLPLTETGTVDVKPGQGAFMLKNPRYLVPGDPKRSMIPYRMQKLGLGRMPHIASAIVHEDAVKIIRDWISQMPERGDEKRSGLKKTE